MYKTKQQNTSSQPAGVESISSQSHVIDTKQSVILKQQMKKDWISWTVIVILLSTSWAVVVADATLWFE